MDSPRDLLTAAQTEVYDLLVQGLSNDEIARELGLTVRTVKAHVSGVLRAAATTRRGEVIAAHGRVTSTGSVAGLKGDLRSERQKQIYDLIVQGLGYKEIAAKTGISERTVKFHAQGILRGLEIGTQARLVAAHWGRTESRKPGAHLTSLLASAIMEARQEQAKLDDIIIQLERAVEALSR